MEQGVEAVGLGAQRGVGTRQRIARPRQLELRRCEVDQRRGASGNGGERGEEVLPAASNPPLETAEAGEERAFARSNRLGSSGSVMVARR
jgi:hypothetical protein